MVVSLVPSFARSVYQQSGYDEPHHVTLARCQQFVTLTQRRDLSKCSSTQTVSPMACVLRPEILIAKCFVRNSTAPAFIARTASGYLVSVMKIMGTYFPAAAIHSVDQCRFCLASSRQKQAAGSVG